MTDAIQPKLLYSNFESPKISIQANPINRKTLDSQTIAIAQKITQNLRSDHGFKKKPNEREEFPRFPLIN
jgi:hypothetical protein